LVLTARRATIEAFRLHDGRLTHDRADALEDLRAQRRQQTPALQQAATGVLRLPVGPVREAATPNRHACIRRMQTAELLPAPIAEHIAGLGGVTDTMWQQLRPLLLLLDPHSLPVEYWQITLEDSAGHWQELPVPYEPLDYLDSEDLPDALARAREALSRSGWRETSRTESGSDLDDPEERWLDAVAITFARRVRRHV
jgi:hypothetical protein